MRGLILVTVIVASIFASVGKAAAASDESKLAREDYSLVVASPEDDPLFKKFLSKLPTVTLGTQPARTFYVLEGDLLLTEQQVRASIRNYADAPRPVLPSGELKVMFANGRPVFWPRGQRRLTYAVNKKSFRSQAEYDLVVKNLAQAAGAWSDACQECGLQYIYQSELDDDPAAGQVVFAVSFKADETQFIAASFFPNDPIDRRTLVIAPSYFTTQVDKVGILRHELGHVIGYRHEHIEGIPGCYMEDNNWKPLTPYDRLSVMHYFCGGGGTLELQLSASDKAGHRQLYGAP